MLSREQQGLIACIASGILWGVGVLFWPLLSYLSPVSILSLRLICSFFFAIFVVYFTSRFSLVKSLFKNRKTLKNLCIATIFLCLNWGFYIYAINSEKAIEVSLGYYLTPLMNIVPGWGLLLALPLLFTVFCIRLLMLMPFHCYLLKL